MLRFPTLVALVLLSGCASSGAVTVGSEFTMAMDQQVALPDASTLRYAGLANDSRCPPDVQCIRAGDADVLFDHTADGTSSRITLNTERSRSALLGAWRLHLVDLTARGNPPLVTLRIDTKGTTSP